MGSEVLGHYDQWLLARNASPGTRRLHRHYLRRLSRMHPDLLTVTLDDLIEFMARPGWAAETRKSCRGALRGFYRWAAETGRIDVDPSRKLPSITVPPGRPRPAPDEALARALLVASPREQLMVMLAAYAGLRRCEIAKVHSRDVAGDRLRVVGKGGKVRIVPLHPQLVAAAAYVPDGYWFPGGVDGHLSPDRVGKLLARLLGERWTAHTLRHRFATKAYAVERDIFAVQQLLGHSKPETTMRYTLVSEDALSRAVSGAA